MINLDKYASDGLVTKGSEDQQAKFDWISHNYCVVEALEGLKYASQA